MGTELAKKLQIGPMAVKSAQNALIPHKTQFLGDRGSTAPPQTTIPLERGNEFLL